MVIIEGGLLVRDVDKKDIEERLSSIKSFGIKDLLFSDFFYMRDFLRMGVSTSGINKFYIICHSNRESVRLIWNLIKNLETFSIFIECKYPTGENFRDALYQGFSFTDCIGLAIGSQGLSCLIKYGIIKSIQNEFIVKEFFILDNEGFDLPKETLKSIKALRSTLLKDSKIFYFPNDKNGLGIINALYAIKGRIDGVVGTILNKGKQDKSCINLMKLNYIYRRKKKNLYSSKIINIIDQIFNNFNGKDNFEFNTEN